MKRKLIDSICCWRILLRGDGKKINTKIIQRNDYLATWIRICAVILLYVITPVECH